MASRRRKRRIIVINPKRRRRRSRSRRRARRSAAPIMLHNPRRRRRARRSSSRRVRRHYRSNPGLLPSSGFVMDAVYVTGGFFATRMVSGMVLPMLPLPDMPAVRILGKGAVAAGLGWIGQRFLGQHAGQLLLLGGLVEVLSDAVRTYVSPFVPALADGGMGSYPTLISSYPTMGSDYSNPYAVSAYDEAV